MEILELTQRQLSEMTAVDNSGNSILRVAMENRAKDIVDFVLKIKRTRDSSNFEHLVIMCLLETESYKMSKLVEQSEISESEIQKFESESTSFVGWILSRYKIMHRYGNWAVSKAIELNLQHILSILLSYTNKIDKQNQLLHQFLRQSKDQRDRHQGKLSYVWYSSYCERYTTKIVRDLLNRGISPEDFDGNGMTALHLAIKFEERIDIIEMLIARSMNVNHKNFNGQTAFYLLICKWIRSEEVSTDYYWKIALALVENGANIYEPDDNGDSPLCIAIEESNLPVVEFISQYVTNFNDITSESVMLVLLLGRRNKISNIETVIKIFDILVSKGCKVNIKNKNGITPLHLFAKTGPTAIVQKLIIEQKIDVNCRDNLGWTPLHYAAQYKGPNCIRVAELLLQLGANIHETTLAGETALNLAISIGRISNHARTTLMLEILLKFGADPNQEFPTLPMKPKIDSYHVWDNGLRSFRKKYIPVKEDEYLFQHWLKLKAAKLYCADNSDYKKFIQVYTKFYQKCLDEIETLKSKFIDGHVSLYTFLHMAPSSRCAYINNVKLKNFIGEPAKLEKNVPEYSILILASYREAVTWKSLLGLAKDTWLELTEIVLPDLCLECIFSFLRGSELFNFVDQR